MVIFIIYISISLSTTICSIFTFISKVLSTDGSTPLLELVASSEEDANDWIVNICQVVADSV